MKATKGNKVYTIDEMQKERYVKDGFDITDDAGRLLQQGAGKTVPYERYQALAAENAALKKQIKARGAKG